jgi:hypothetical protein
MNAHVIAHVHAGLPLDSKERLCNTDSWERNRNGDRKGQEKHE